LWYGEGGAQAKGVKNISTAQPPLCHRCKWILLVCFLFYTGFSDVGRDANVFYTFCLLAFSKKDKGYNIQPLGISKTLNNVYFLKKLLQIDSGNVKL